MSASLNTSVIMPSGIKLGWGYTSESGSLETDYQDGLYSWNPNKERSLKWGMKPISQALFDRVKRMAVNSSTPGWWVRPVLSQEEIEAQMEADRKYENMMRWEEMTSY